MATADPILTILFVDISESSKLYRLLGDQQASHVVTDFLDRLAEITHAHEGTVVDRIGDELMTLFEDGSSALRSAIAMQWAANDFTHEHLSSDSRLAVRVGLHTGPTMMDNGRPKGQSVYRAKRVVENTKAHQILLDHETFGSLEDAGQWDVRPLNTIGLKGQGKPASLVEVFWNKAESTLLNHQKPQLPTAAVGVTLEVGGDTIQVEEHQRISVGRLAPCEIVLPHSSISRIHAYFKSRKQSIYVEDVSTNGCYVQQDGEAAPNFVHGDEVALIGSGLIGLGKPPESGSLHTIRYACISS